jgi:hypothetical protein
MAPTLTNYENIAVTLCLMSIAILRRRLRDRERVRWRATRSWLLRRKQRSACNTLLKELHTEDPNEFRNYFRMDKTTIQSILLWFHLSILISYSSCWFSLSRLFIIKIFIDNTQTHKCATWGHNIYTVLHGKMIIYYQKQQFSLWTMITFYKLLHYKKIGDHSF